MITLTESVHITQLSRLLRDYNNDVNQITGTLIEQGAPTKLIENTLIQIDNDYSRLIIEKCQDYA